MLEVEKKEAVMDDVEKAKQLIQDERKSREDACVKEINEVLKKYNCTAIIEGQFSGNQFQSGLRVQSL